MFEIGKYVVYGTVGVCEVRDIAPLSFGQGGLYYTLHVIHDKPNNFVYVPVASVETGKVLLRDMISPEQAEAFLQTPPLTLEWIPDLRKRNEAYTQLVASGQPSDWKRLMVCLYHKQKEKYEEQRTLPRRDQELLNLSEKLFYGELSTVLQRDAEGLKQEFMEMLGIVLNRV